MIIFFLFNFVNCQNLIHKKLYSLMILTNNTKKVEKKIWSIDKD